MEKTERITMGDRKTAEKKEKRTKKRMGMDKRRREEKKEKRGERGKEKRG